MNLNICNNCGGTYEYRGGRYVCRACGSYRYENLSDEEKAAVQEAAKMLFAGDFEAAEEAFGKIIFRYPATAEAYWGRLKAHYRVLYAQDMYGRMAPISCEPLSESVLSTLDYRKAIGFSDVENGYFLKAQAEVIEGLRVINGKKPAMQTAVPNIVSDTTEEVRTEEVREEPREEIQEENQTQIREDVREEVVEEVMPLADEEENPETETSEKIQDIPKEHKSKAGRRILGLVLIAGVIVGVNTAFANAHSKTNQPNYTTKNTTFGTSMATVATTVGGSSNKPTAAVSQGLSFQSNGNGTCTLIGIGSCTDTDIVIPSEYNGMRVTNIGYSAFYSCTRFKSVTIPESVTNLGTSSFKLCSKLTKIYYEGTTEQWKQMIFGASWDSGTSDYTVHCSNGTVAKNG